MSPLLKKLDFQFIQSFKTLNDESKTVIGITKKHAFISYDMGISWRRIEGIDSSDPIYFAYYRTARYDGVIKIEEARSLCTYLVDIRGNVLKKVPFGEVSQHPRNPNAIVAEDPNDKANIPNLAEYQDPMDSFEQIFYYTKDGGATQWKELEWKDSIPWLDIDFEFIDGGVPDLLYKLVRDQSGVWTEYALNFFSESPLKFVKLPFEVLKSQGIFFGFEDERELYVSEDGVNFEHIRFPDYQSSSEAGPLCFIDREEVQSKSMMAHKSGRRLKGSLFVLRYYSLSKTKLRDSTILPWTTLFRYDIKRKEIKFMIDYCYDCQVLSAEEGIIIANIVTNPQEHLDNKEAPNIKTFITFNDGNDWETMKGLNGAELSVFNGRWPNLVYNTNGKDNNTPSVPGLLIVHGKERPMEDYKTLSRQIPRRKLIPEFFSSLSTYITKDSGKSWCKINDNMMDWAIGGSGEIIILQSIRSIDYILYSQDSGTTWHRLYFDVPLFRLGVIAPLSCTSRRFLLTQNGRSSYLLSFDPADQMEQS